MTVRLWIIRRLCRSLFGYGLMTYQDDENDYAAFLVPDPWLREVDKGRWWR